MSGESGDISELSVLSGQRFRLMSIFVCEAIRTGRAVVSLGLADGIAAYDTDTNADGFCHLLTPPLTHHLTTRSPQLMPQYSQSKNYHKSVGKRFWLRKSIIGQHNNYSHTEVNSTLIITILMSHL